MCQLRLGAVVKETSNANLMAEMKALKSDLQEPGKLYNLGIVFQRSGAHKEAVESFSMYILIPDLKPEFVADGLNNRAISQRALKNLI